MAHYTAPLPWHHVLHLFGGYSEVHPTITLLNSARSDGQSMQASFRYIIPFTAGHYFLHDFSFGFDWKRTNTTVSLVETHPVFGDHINITQFVLSL